MKEVNDIAPYFGFISTSFVKGTPIFQGNKRKAYRKGSFDLTNYSKNIEGGSIISEKHYLLQVKVTDPAVFKIKIGPCDFYDWPDIYIHAESLS